MQVLTFIFLGTTVTVVVLFLLSRKRKQKQRAHVIQDPSVYSALLEEHVSFYKQLEKTEKERFLEEVSHFLNSVHVEGVGTDVDDLDRALVAASAIIPVFSFKGWRYRQLTNVILYPDTFNKDFQFKGAQRDTLGMVGEGYMNGQMLLSKKALRNGFSASAGNSNTSIHEFVHLIDKSDGNVDGVPETLLAKPYVIPWIKMMHNEMRKIRKGASDIDPYALTNEAEFFAVVSEYFFEKPEKFSQHHPELFNMLNELFKRIKMK